LLGAPRPGPKPKVVRHGEASAMPMTLMETDFDRDDGVDLALRTIVADDDALARRLIRRTLQQADITVVAEASVGREAVELAVFYGPTSW
jgi:PleD family two-component response regulator